MEPISSFFSKLGNAFGGIFLGLALFIGSFFIVYQNEGRINYKDVAEKAVPIEQAQKADDLVFVTDKITSTETLSDGEYIKTGPYIFLKRIVEMYSWAEDKVTKKDSSGSSTEEYTYKKVWTASPQDSSRFANPEGHYNPALPISETTATVSTASIGAYQIKPQSVKLPSTKKVSLSQEKLLNGTGTGVSLVDNFIYMGSGTLMQPVIGDTRISFAAVYNGMKGTIFGKKSDGELLPHHIPEMREIYRIFEGDKNDSLMVLQQEYSFQLWMWRAIGFVVLWMSLLMILKPLTVLLDVVPVLGKFANGAISFVTFLIALILTVITSLVSIVMHNIFGIIGIALLSLVAVYFVFFHKNPTPAPTSTKS